MPHEHEGASAARPAAQLSCFGARGPGSRINASRATRTAFGGGDGGGAGGDGGSAGGGEGDSEGGGGEGDGGAGGVTGSGEVGGEAGGSAVLLSSSLPTAGSTASMRSCGSSDGGGP